MNIVVLDGYSLNPGDLSWHGLNQEGELTVYPRTSADEVIERCVEADAIGHRIQRGRHRCCPCTGHRCNQCAGL